MPSLVVHPPTSNRSPVALALLLLGTLAGCSGLPDEPAAQLTAQATPPLSSGPATQALPARWWQLYRDPQLDLLVEQALSHNQDLEAAAAHVDALLARLEQVEGERQPSTRLAYSVGYGRSRDDQTLAQASGEQADAEWSHAPGFSLSYTLDLWGEMRYRLAAARADAQAARALEDEWRVTVAAQTTRAYGQACVYAFSRQVQRHSVQVLERSVDVTRRLQKAGAATALDLARLNGLLEETRAPLPLLAARHQAALYELAVLSGLPPLAVARQTCAQRPQLQAPLPVGDGWALVQRRADIRRAERQLQSATLAIGIARAALYPRVTFGAALASSASSLGKLGDSEALVYSVGPLLSWRFPQRGVARAQVGQRRAQAREAQARFDGTVLSALKQVEQALVLYQAEQQRRQALQAALDHSQQAFELATRSYRAGALDALHLLDSERRLVTLQATLARADLRLINRQIDLFQALGGGWQRDDQPQPLPLAALGAKP
ncbi:multidrug transporter [Pseudomonas sp. ICMP 8385]|uniref:Efflux transporter outer membrane subunit n=1 Tax=Pseudomonas gessardii TaxID=78544 RepID=A0ABS9F4V8_9PSED|nr:MULTISPECIES: TolC family protein [Pseudomonas]MCF4979976.1 efflux transporter outer membrane subunit [Pseudomonas gessardii]MCF4990413.1 efflux transporter outer membrane subunit [Pseudomonas gessardii]MCF5087284.1 efflux transporter outer membrane subunit [Pseudomonas gessardii]MCF5096807.1 efflux transporter outer membrane subunit [Pseudomonas gessardii]MCF5107395.1 efflux transporter outer membrane subunit [Pseudomonas gessardii]